MAIANPINLDKIVQNIKNEENLSKQDEAQKALDNGGASVVETISHLTDILKETASDNLRLKTIEKILGIHGVNNSSEAKDATPVIQIVLNDSDVKIQNILNPRR